MSAETGGLVERYAAWLLASSAERVLDGGWKELTFPFLDRHNDHLQVFARETLDGRLCVTDDGRTIQDLSQSGCDLKSTSRRKRMAERVLRSHGLDPALLAKGELTVEAVNGDFPDKLQSLLLSMLAIDGLASVSPPNVAAIFKEDVADWLNASGKKYERDVLYTGHSGEPREFDFRVPASDRHPAKILHAIATPDKTHVQSFTFEVIDTRAGLEGNPPEFFAVLKDPSVSRRSYLSLLSQEITPVRWAEREAFAARL